MNDEFAVDETGMTADGYHCLLPVSKKSMYISHLIIFAAMTAAFICGMYLFKTPTGKYYDILLMCFLAGYIVVSVYLFVSPSVFYRRYRYRLDDDKAEIRRGVITVSHTLVPIERIHQVEVSRGPINRMFGLANVNITTAGGVTSLEYLDEETAESIASLLNEYVVKLLKDRD